MTDISIIKMIISVAVWRIYPSWVNDKLRAWEGLGHSGMFWARLSRDDFRSKLEIISFLSWVMSVSKSFSVSRAFQRFGAKCSSSGAFGLEDVLGIFLKTPLRHRAFLWTLTTTTSISWKFSFLFSKAEPVYLPDSYGDQLWAKHFGDGTSKTRMKTRLPGVVEIERRSTIDRRRDWYESCAMIHGPEEKKKTQGSQRVIVRRLDLSSSTNQRVLRSLFPRPDVATVSHFEVFLDVDVHLQDGQAAARGQRSRKSSHPWHFHVDYWGVTNLSAPIWFTRQGH